jgi:hypothetical protein
VTGFLLDTNAALIALSDPARLAGANAAFQTDLLTE